MKFIAAIVCALAFVSGAGAKPASTTNLVLAPPNFDLANGRGHAVFVDFIAAEYSISFDITRKETFVRSIIQFNNAEAGMPIFDMVDEPTSVTLDGKSVEQLLTPPPMAEDSSDALRVVTETLAPGTHVMIIEHKIEQHAATFSKDSVSSGFFMSDLDSRGLLERYLPTNFEFDQMVMRFNVEIVGTAREERIFSNGFVSQVGPQQWVIDFPTYFNCSAVYFHIKPKDQVKVTEYIFASVDQRQIPVTVYSNKGLGGDDYEYGYKDALDKALAEFESRFGPFPHPSVTVYGTETMDGGMEYSGATVTNLWALKHEIAHSYFGRGIMPANGNAGWIDEALASLAGGPYSPDPDDIQPVNMGNHSPYYRANDSNGYGYGMNFLAYLGREFNRANQAQSIDQFLAGWMVLRPHWVTTTPMLEADLQLYSTMDMSGLFKKYVYGERTPGVVTKTKNPHARLTAKELRALQ